MATNRSTTTRRTLHYYWQVTRKHFGLFAALMASTFLFVALLSYGNPYVMSLVVDRVSTGSVESDQVFAVYGPYIAALIAINVLGQAASKLQDYTMYKLEIAAAYDLATMSFDALCNQSMSFHSNRFGGTLVSQTSKFMSAYQLLLETITFPFLPVICSVIFTCAILAPRVPVYVVILMALLVVYACVSYYMYKRILSLNEKAASAQNQLSGELSDSVANILAVKTSGREDYERALFDQANRQVVERDSKRMWASLARGIITACTHRSHHERGGSMFIAGGNAWYGISAGTLVMMFTYTYNRHERSFNLINSTASQRLNRGLRRRLRHDAHPRRAAAGGRPARARRTCAGRSRAATSTSRGSASHYDRRPSERHARVRRTSTCTFPGRPARWSGGPERARARPRSRSCCCALSDVQDGRSARRRAGHRRSARSKACAAPIAYVPQEALLFHRSIAREHRLRASPDATRGADPSRPRPRRTRSDFIVQPARRVRYDGGGARREALRRAAPARRDRARACWLTAPGRSCWTKPPAPSTPKARRSCKTLCRS